MRETLFNHPEAHARADGGKDRTPVSETHGGPFSAACGLDGPLTIDVEGPVEGSRRTYTFERPFALIGRSERVDVVLDDPAVSRIHGYIQIIGGRPFCVDLNSRSGIRWRQGPDTWGWIGPDEGVGVGPFRVFPRVGAAAETGNVYEDPLPISRSFAPVFTDEVGIADVGRGSDGSFWRINRAIILIGKPPSCKVQLMGAGVTAVHAGLVRTPAGIWAIDLLNRSSLEVNGKRVRFSRLDDGDELRIRSYRLRIQVGPPAGGTSRSLALAEHRPPTSTELVPVSPQFSSGFLDPTVRALIEEIGGMQRQTNEQFENALMTMFRMFDGMHREQMALVREEIARLHELLDRERTLRQPMERPSHTLPSPEALPRPATLRLVHDAVDVRPEPATPTATDAPRVTREVRPTPDSLSGVGIHDEIVRKIAALQSERQGRWQNLLNGLIGHGPRK